MMPGFVSLERMLASYAVLFTSLFGATEVMWIGGALLIIMNIVGFVLTLPPKYLEWRTMRGAIACLFKGSDQCITGYPRLGHQSINVLLTGFLSIIVMVGLVLLTDSVLIRVPNLSFSILACLLTGMLITRMQLAHDLESG